MGVAAAGGRYLGALVLITTGDSDPLVVSPMGCLCGAVAVTLTLSLSGWKPASAWPMSYWPLTGPNPQNNISG